jgi:death-on-curing protein
VSEDALLYLTVEDLLLIAERVVGPDAVVRDIGLLEAAVARPQASVFGVPAYATVPERAAALVHSIVRNHALIDGNKRLGLAGLIVFLHINGWRLTWSNDEAYDVVMAVASSEIDDVPTLAALIATGSAPVGA